MGFYDLIETISASIPIGQPAYADSASESKDQDDDSKPEKKLKEGEDKDGGEDAHAKDDSEEGGDDAGEEGEDGDGAEEEEEEEEPEDPKEKLEEECRNSNECKKYKSHYDACAARVDDGAKEDCVEEFFELAHCATNCAAPKLWKLLK